MALIPAWAKMVGGTLGGAMLVLVLFVTRAEYAANAARVDARLASISENVTDILWRVGGPRDGAYFAENVNSPLVEKAWVKAMQIAKIPRSERAAIERPSVILFDESRYALPHEETRWCGLTWSVYVRDGDGFKRRIFTELFIPLADSDTLYKGLVHEFLHYLLGLDTGQLASEEAVRTVWPYECPAN